MISSPSPTTIHSRSFHDTTVPSVSSGNYTGNGGVNRAIPHGLTLVKPKIILVQYLTAVGGEYSGFQIYDTEWKDFSVGGSNTVTAKDTTNFYVSTSFMNIAGANYHWVAIG